MDQREASEKLVAEFPELFSECDSLSCPGPWYEIVRELSLKIVSVDPERRVSQVKPKCGSLRFYLHPSRVDRLIREAELRAEVVCEKCGAPGKPKGWYVLCGSCK